jgi:hypothetical protein
VQQTESSSTLSFAVVEDLAALFGLHARALAVKGPLTMAMFHTSPPRDDQAHHFLCLFLLYGSSPLYRSSTVAAQSYVDAVHAILDAQWRS